MATAGRTLGSAVLLVALGLSPALGYATTFVLLGLAALATVMLVAAPSPASGGPPPPSSTGEDQGTAGAHVDEARSRRDPPPFTGEGDQRSWWRGRPSAPTLLFALAYLLIALSTLITVRTPADLLPLLGLTAPLFFALLANLFALQGPLTRPAADLSPQGEVTVGHDLAFAPPLPGGRGRREAAGEGAFAMLPQIAILGAFVGLATAFLYRYGLNMPRAAEGFWLTDPYRLAVTTLLSATLGLGAWFGSAPLPPEGRGRGWGGIDDHRTTPSLDPSPQGGGKRWLSLLAVAAAIMVIVLTGSRTALLGLPVLLLVTGLCLARRPATRIAVVVAAAAVVLAALFVELPGTERMRLWDVLAAMVAGSPVADPAIDIRIGLAHAATQLFRSAPLFGHGWSETTMPEVLALLTPAQLSWGRIPHLHSDLAQFAVSGGLFGLAAYVLLLLAPVAGYLQLPRETRTPQRLHALLVLVIGAIVLGLPDTFLAAPMTLTIYVVLAATIAGGSARGPHPTQLR